MSRALMYLSALLYAGLAVFFAPYVHQLFRAAGWAALLPAMVFSLGGIACALLMALSADRGNALLMTSLASLLVPAIETFSYAQQGSRTEGVAFLPGLATLLLITSAAVHRVITQTEVKRRAE